jgi:hypothetical protein
MDRLAGSLNERDQDTQGPAAEVHRLPVLEQNALPG